MMRWGILALAILLGAINPSFAQSGGAIGGNATIGFAIALVSNQTGVADASFTTVTFNNKSGNQYDPSSLCGSSNGVCTMNRTGIWHFDTAVVATGAIAAGGFLQVAFYKNGFIARTCEFYQGSTTSATGDCSTDLNMIPGDTIEVKVNVDLSSSTGTFNGTAAASDTWFNGHFNP